MTAPSSNEERIYNMSTISVTICDNIIISQIVGQFVVQFHFLFLSRIE